MKFFFTTWMILAVLGVGAGAQPATEQPKPPAATEPKIVAPAESPKVDPATPADKPAGAANPADPAAEGQADGPSRNPPPDGVNSAAPANPVPAPGIAAPKLDVPAWEQGITRVTVLDGNLPIAVPVGDANAAKSALASGKVPRVFSPYPAKALLPVPDGWMLAADPSVPAALQRVTLAGGRVLEMAVSPPVLQPANPRAISITLPTTAESLVEALGSARRTQAKSAASLRALADALAERLPEPAPEVPSPVR